MKFIALLSGLTISDPPIWCCTRWSRKNWDQLVGCLAWPRLPQDRPRSRFVRFLTSNTPKIWLLNQICLAWIFSFQLREIMTKQRLWWRCSELKLSKDALPFCCLLPSVKRWIRWQTIWHSKAFLHLRIMRGKQTSRGTTYRSNFARIRFAFFAAQSPIRWVLTKRTSRVWSITICLDLLRIMCKRLDAQVETENWLVVICFWKMKTSTSWEESHCAIYLTISRELFWQAGLYVRRKRSFLGSWSQNLR